MTIFVDPYQTTAGVILDMNKTLTPLKESTIRDPLTGTNLGVRSCQGVTPVFITGCRDSEQSVPSFTHPIFIKNFNGKSYLFTDMKLFVSSGGTLQTIDSHIRRREEFEFTKARAIASLVWAAGEYDRFNGSMAFVGEVFATWISQTLSRSFALDFVATTKIQMIALAYWEGLFKETTHALAKDDDLRMISAQRASRAWKVPVTQAVEFYKTLTEPMSNISDLCDTIVKSLDNVNLNPLPGNPTSGFNVRVLLNLIADAWYSAQSKPILASALEHPPTMCAIVYYCANYNNFRRQQLGQTIQSVGRGGKGESFNRAFKQLLDEYTQPEGRVVSVMEYLNPENFAGEAADDSAVARLMAELHEKESEGMNKVVDSMENHHASFESLDDILAQIHEGLKEPGVTGTLDPGTGSVDGGDVVLSKSDTIGGRPVM